MLNVYVHAAVCGLPTRLLDDDAFLDAVFLALPDACVGGREGVLDITVSQFHWTDRRAGSRQLQRIRRALTALGHPGAFVLVDELAREGWRDDLQVVVGAVRWRFRRLMARG